MTLLAMRLFRSSEKAITECRRLSTLFDQVAREGAFSTPSGRSEWRLCGSQISPSLAATGRATG